MRSTSLLILASWLLLATVGFSRPMKGEVVVQHGFVPDAGTAIKIAVAAWIPIYGKKQISKQAPYRATLNSGVWTVRGSLSKKQVGGVALAEIAQDDGRILRGSHGR